MKETSLTKAADPVSVFIGSTLFTSAGSVAFDGLEKEGVSLEGVGKIYPTSGDCQPIAEESTVPPVANGLGSAPTNWFELAADLCLNGHITETRMRRAIAAVRQGVERE